MREHPFPSTMADSIAKNFTITHAMRSKFASLGNRLLKGDTRAQRQQIKDFLDEEPDLVGPTLLLLQSGLMYDFLGNIQRRLPQSCTKLHLVPVRTMTKSIVSHSALSLGELKSLRKESAKDKTNVLEHLFCFAVRLDREAPVVERQEDAFLADMEARHQAAGEPLMTLELGGARVDWNKSGVYALVTESGAMSPPPFTHVLHRASQQKAMLMGSGRLCGLTHGGCVPGIRGRDFLGETCVSLVVRWVSTCIGAIFRQSGQGRMRSGSRMAGLPLAHVVHACGTCAACSPGRLATLRAGDLRLT